MNLLLFEINPFIPPSVPISLAYIGAYAQAHGFGVKIITIGEGTPFCFRHLQTLIEEYKPRLVGFSTYQRNIFYVLGLAKAIKKINPEIKTVIGGPQATFLPSLSLAQGPIDFICREEGELAFFTIAKTLQEDSAIRLVSGCSCKLEDGRFSDGPPLLGYKNLDHLPSPYLTDGLIDFEKIDEAILLTSRGCPYHCIFCYTPNAFKQKVLFHSIERVMEEIERIVKKGIKKIWFADPSFSFHLERVDQLMEKILEKNFKVEIWLETRADLINTEVLKKMNRAGVKQVAYGLESASEKVLSSLKKKISLDQIRRAIELTHQQGIDVELFTQFGLPLETFEDAMMTLEFLKDNQVPIRGNSNSQQTQIYFGTELQHHHKKYGVFPLENQTPPYLSIGDQYETSCLSSGEIKKIKAIWEKESLDGGKRKVS